MYNPDPGELLGEHLPRMCEAQASVSSTEKKRKKHQMVKVAGKLELSQVWWHKLVIPERGRWRQEDQESSDQGWGRWLRCGTSEGLRSALGSHVRKLATWCAFRIPVLERWRQESLQGSLHPALPNQ